MKIITAPSVYLIGRQVVDESEIFQFLAAHGVEWESDSEVGAEVITETAGRVCYMSFAKPRPGGNAAYLHHIKEVGHGSVFEHAVWTIIVTGISRSLSHELIRHRAGVSPSELSQRYVDCSDVDFVLPPAMLPDHADFLTVETFIDGGGTDIDDHPAYGGWDRFKWWRARRSEDLAEYASETRRFTESAPADLSGTDRRKWARQAARNVLPNCTETRAQLTVNARAIRNILEQRGSRHADAEIRRLANVLLDVFARAAPNLFGDYIRTPLPDGTNEITTPYPKI